MHVLIVEDDVLAAFAIESALADYGATSVDVAVDGATAEFAPTAAGSHLCRLPAAGRRGRLQHCAVSGTYPQGAPHLRD
jgi:hypothetical protein